MSFKEYWDHGRPKIWNQKSEENKHLHTWLCALAVRSEEIAALKAELQRLTKSLRSPR